MKFMKRKKILAVVLSTVLVLSLLGVIPTESVVFAQEDVSENRNRFHYEQLSETGKSVYDGIYKMYEQDILKTGTGDYDLVENGHVTKEQAQNYENNNSELMEAMNAARYAFYADYPEVFYVNFPKLTLRTTKDADGNLHIYLGSGRYPNYYIDGFESKEEVDKAITDFDRRVNELVAGAEALEIEEGKNKQAEQVKYVHNEIIENVSYRLEDTAYAGDENHPGSNAPYLGTPYGVLVRKQGVCEGYARAFKTVMDHLGINCILVQGAHRYDEIAVAHMWNYVEIEDSSARSAGGRWYAVDVTLDDPEIPVVTESEQERERNKYFVHFEEYGNDGFEQEKYLLVGQVTMNEKHYVADEVAAAGDYQFQYPVLEDNDFTMKMVTNDLDGFIVRTKDITSSVSQQTITEYQFSYQGMTATEARTKGIYLVWRYYEEKEGEIVPVYSQYGSWFYLDPEVYQLKEENGFTIIQEGNQPYIEIAATTTPPSDNSADPFQCLTYLGDDSGLIARTGKIYNENQTGYKAPPYIVRQTPSQTGAIAISDRFYHFVVEYDEALKLAEGVALEDVKTKITCRSRMGAYVTGAEYSEIKNFEWDGNKTVKFDMKFSMMYADDSVIYNIFFDGLIGENSEKTPNPVSCVACQKTQCPSIQHRNGSWDIFGKPTLLENEDLSLDGWRTANGRNVSDLLKDRLTLVAARTTEEQNRQMEGMVKNDKIIDSATYNITLTVCKQAVIETGHKVRVRLGFPEGYGPNDEGVTFKAYHFTRDNQGNITGVEEIDCVVTQYGLILTCDAFSPFMIAVVEKDEMVPDNKILVVTASDGGLLTGANLDTSGIVTLTEGQSEIFQAKAKEGYQIESITVGGKNIEVTNSDSMDIAVSYTDIQNANNIVNVNFVAKSVVEKEKERNEAPVQPVVEEAAISMPGDLTVTEAQNLIIEPQISETTGVQTYQWYKNEEKLEGKISRILEINNAAKEDEGSYQIKVTNTVSTVSVDSFSDPCAVTVSLNSEAANSVPVILADDKTLTVGDTFDPLSDITASDEEDGDITAYIQIVKNDVDTSIAGTYEVVYSVTDSQGVSCTKTVYVTVNPKLEVVNQIPTITAGDQTLRAGDAFDPLRDVTAADEEDGDMTAHIQIIKNDVDTSIAGTYEVVYKVTDSQGASCTKTISVTVNPKMEALNHIPVISAGDQTLRAGDAFDPLRDVTASDEEDGDMTAHIQVIKNYVDISKAGIYEVEYSVTDSQGASCTKTIYVTVAPKLEVLNHIPIIAASDQTLRVGDAFDPLNDVIASDEEDGDITANIVIIKNDVDTSAAGTYEVVYSVTDSQGASCTRTISVTVQEKETPEKPENPAKPENPEKPESKPNQADALPETGDHMDSGWYLELLAVSGLLIVILVRGKKKSMA
ncbi:MAG TPA: hypothetical protein DCZ20_00995 [Lachnospiraceae bacterium]|nr:hypothetical protein [Lachnospiraceae bacterium]